MPDELPPSPPKTPPPGLPRVRPPVPGWMWALFGLGFIPFGALISVAAAQPPADQIVTMLLVGGAGGLVLGLPMLGGLALSARFFNETGTRIVGGVVFAVVLTVGLVGILFAGCMCLISGQNFGR